MHFIWFSSGLKSTDLKMLPFSQYIFIHCAETLPLNWLQLIIIFKWSVAPYEGCFNFFHSILDVYEQLKTQLWEDDAVTGLSVFNFTVSINLLLVFLVTCSWTTIVANSLGTLNMFKPSVKSDSCIGAWVWFKRNRMS